MKQLRAKQYAQTLRRGSGDSMYTRKAADLEHLERRKEKMH